MDYRFHTINAQTVFQENTKKQYNVFIQNIVNTEPEPKLYKLLSFQSLMEYNSAHKQITQEPSSRHQMTTL